MNFHYDGVKPYQTIVVDGNHTSLMFNNELTPKEGYDKSQMICVMDRNILRSHDEFNSLGNEQLQSYATALGFKLSDTEYHMSHGFNRIFIKVHFKL